MPEYVNELEVGKRYGVFFSDEECCCTTLCYGNSGYLLRDDGNNMEWSVPSNYKDNSLSPTFIETDEIINTLRYGDNDE